MIIQMSIPSYTFYYLRFGTNSNRTIYEETTELEITERVGMAVGTAMVTASHLLSVFPFPFTWLQQGVSTVVFLGNIWFYSYLHLTAMWYDEHMIFNFLMEERKIIFFYLCLIMEIVFYKHSNACYNEQLSPFYNCFRAMNLM